MIATLLTDFGTRDEYVGVLKGVILGINPQVALVDLCHHIAPQDIAAAGHLLRSAYVYFPEGTVHLAIVDPGVGTDRHIIAARWKHHFFMAPDNGLLPLVCGHDAPETLVRVENTALFRQPVSRTFHGRDIFAPVAAHLTKGFELEKVGPHITLAELHRLDSAPAGLDISGDLIGVVVRVDRFGNLITNIEMTRLKEYAGSAQTAPIGINVGGFSIEGLSQTYSDGVDQQPLALIGSHNCLEIAIGGGNAAKSLGVGCGANVRIKVLA